MSAAGKMAAGAGGRELCGVTASSTCGACPEIVPTDMTKAKHSGAFKGHRFPPEFIAFAIWS
ncbi:MAG: hypothetical protein ABJV68_11930, partial [Paracoccaceae bacterium]